MGLTIGIAIDDKTIEQEEYVLLDDELIEYVCHLEKFPTLRELGKFDPYGDTLISLAMQKELKRELPEIIKLAKKQGLPKPPDYVGLEGSTDTKYGEKFGWHGLISFLSSLDKIIDNNKPLLAIGD